MTFIAACGAEGVYRGLQSRFGPNVIAGYREYKRQCAFWESVKEPDGSYGLPKLNAAAPENVDRTPDRDR